MRGHHSQPDTHTPSPRTRETRPWALPSLTLKTKLRGFGPSQACQTAGQARPSQSPRQRARGCGVGWRAASRGNEREKGVWPRGGRLREELPSEISGQVTGPLSWTHPFQGAPGDTEGCGRDGEGTGRRGPGLVVGAWPGSGGLAGWRGSGQVGSQRFSVESEKHCPCSGRGSPESGPAGAGAVGAGRTPGVVCPELGRLKCVTQRRGAVRKEGDRRQSPRGPRQEREGFSEGWGGGKRGTGVRPRSGAGGGTAQNAGFSSQREGAVAAGSWLS